MAKLDERLGYHYSVKDALLDEIAALPGADSASVRAGKPAEINIGSRALANIATYRNGNTSSALRVLLALPEDERLYGVVGVTVDDHEDLPLYGLSVFPDDPQGQARWRGNITRGIGRIRPEIPSARNARELPWSATIIAGPAGSLAVSYSGAEFVDVIGVPQVEGQMELDMPSELWCPPASELVELVKPTV